MTKFGTEGRRWVLPRFGSVLQWAGLLLIGAVAGALLGLQPMLAVPMGILAVVVAAIWGGVVSSRRIMGGTEAGWSAYLVLTFWVLTVNLPALVAFDQTGFTRDHGLFNAQSIGRIALLLSAAFLALIYWIMWGRDPTIPQTAKRVPGAALLFSLYLWYLVQAPLVAEGTQLAVAMFRVIEWLVALGLLYLAFTLQNARGRVAFDDRLRLITPMLFFLLSSILATLAVAPQRVYQQSEVTGTSRLGGLFTHPNLLAIVCAVLFAYGLGYCRGLWRVVLAATCVVVLGFTYSRGGYVAFVLVLVLGLALLVRHIWGRVVLVAGAAAVIALLFYTPLTSDYLSRFLARGQETKTLTTLSERTAVWEAAKALIARSPWLGEGFSAGPKMLGEEMIRSRLSRNFAAPHAHNELLQAQISGGIVAAALTIAIHMRIFFLLMVVRLARREAFAIWAMVLSVLVWGLLAPSLSYLLSLPGVMLGWSLLTLEGLRRDQTRGD